MSYNGLIRNGNKKYYVVIEEAVRLAGSDYYIDHRDKLPVGNETSEISLGDLIDSNYMEPIRDSQGNTCVEGKVYARRVNNRYVYEVCLECYNYQSDEAKCKNTKKNNL